MPESTPLIPELPGSRSVLVVDDAAIVRRLAFRLLSEAGYRVFEAGGAAEALEVLSMAGGRIDVVLVDVVMPDVSGVDLARLVQEAAPSAVAVYMSAFPAEVMVREGLRNPSVLFLAKPFTREELLRAVGRAMARRSDSIRQPSPPPRRGTSG